MIIANKILSAIFPENHDEFEIIMDTIGRKLT